MDLRPRRSKDTKDKVDTKDSSIVDTKDSDIMAISRVFYERAQQAVEDLQAFLASLHRGQQPLCVTYFDEAHELQIRLWILLRLLSHQPKTVKMWYVFLGTKSSISYYTPATAACVSSIFAHVLISLPKNSAFSAARLGTATIGATIYRT